MNKTKKTFNKIKTNIKLYKINKESTTIILFFKIYLTITSVLDK